MLALPHLSVISLSALKTTRSLSASASMVWRLPIDLAVSPMASSTKLTINPITIGSLNWPLMKESAALRPLSLGMTFTVVMAESGVALGLPAKSTKGMPSRRSAMVPMTMPSGANGSACSAASLGASTLDASRCSMSVFKDLLRLHHDVAAALCVDVLAVDDDVAVFLERDRCAAALNGELIGDVYNAVLPALDHVVFAG